MTRCNHRGSACAHVRYPQQAYRVGPESATWQDVAEIVGGTVVLLTLFIGIPFVIWLVAA
jgi:hypothetical protein